MSDDENATRKAGIPNWRTVDLPERVRSIPTMLMEAELQLLFSMARDYFRNEGFIVDAGAFLGGSTAALGAGLLENSKFLASPRERVIVSYDLFTLWGQAARAYFPPDTPQGHDFLDIFTGHTAFIGDVLEVRAGDIAQSGPPPCPIEILFIDVAKSSSLSDWIVYNCFEALIPGHSIVVHQDYLFTGWNAWLHATMEYYADHFEVVDDTGKNSVVFRYTKEIPKSQLPLRLTGGMRRAELLDLHERAASRFHGKQRDILLQSRMHLETILDQWPE